MGVGVGPGGANGGLARAGEERRGEAATGQAPVAAEKVNRREFAAAEFPGDAPGQDARVAQQLPRRRGPVRLRVRAFGIRGQSGKGRFRKRRYVGHGSFLPGSGWLGAQVAVTASRAARTSSGAGRASCWITVPSRRNTKFGHSLTRKDPPSGRPLPSSTLTCRTSADRASKSRRFG